MHSLQQSFGTETSLDWRGLVAVRYALHTRLVQFAGLPPGEAEGLRCGADRHFLRNSNIRIFKAVETLTKASSPALYVVSRGEKSDSRLVFLVTSHFTMCARGAVTALAVASCNDETGRLL